MTYVTFSQNDDQCIKSTAWCAIQIDYYPLPTTYYLLGYYYYYNNPRHLTRRNVDLEVLQKGPKSGVLADPTASATSQVRRQIFVHRKSAKNIWIQLVTCCFEIAIHDCIVPTFNLSVTDRMENTTRICFPVSICRVRFYTTSWTETSSWELKLFKNFTSILVYSYTSAVILKVSHK